MSSLSAPRLSSSDTVDGFVIRQNPTSNSTLTAGRHGACHNENFNVLCNTPPIKSRERCVNRNASDPGPDVTPPSRAYGSQKDGSSPYNGARRRLSLAQRRGSGPLSISIPRFNLFEAPSPEEIKEDNTCETQRDSLFREATAVLSDLHTAISDEVESPNLKRSSHTSTNCLPQVSGWAASEFDRFMSEITRKYLPSPYLPTRRRALSLSNPMLSDHYISGKRVAYVDCLPENYEEYDENYRTPKRIRSSMD